MSIHGWMSPVVVILPSLAAMSCYTTLLLCLVPLPGSSGQRLSNNKWTIRANVIRTVLCCIVYDNCAQRYAHAWAVLNVGCCFGLSFSLDLLFVCCLPFHACVVCVCCVMFSFFSTKPRGWLGRTFLKWRILYWIGRKTFCLQCFETVDWRHEGHPFGKNWVMRYWRGYLVIMELQMICIWFSSCHCHPVVSCFIKIRLVSSVVS